jgi:hypothetical protein
MTDEGMPNGPSIFAYLVFGPGGTSTEGIIKPMKLIAWRGLGEKLAMQGEDSKKPSWIRTRLGFYLPTLYVVDLESNPETQPSHIKGWEGDPRASLDTFRHHPPERS